MHWILRLFLYCFSLVMYANVSGKMTRLTIHTLYCVCCTHIYMFHISLLCTGFYICFFIVSLLLCNPMYLEKWRGSQFIHYNEYVAHIYTLPSRPLLPYNLVHTCFEVRWDVGAHVMRHVNYVHALHKFRSLRITLWYNVLPLITFNHAFIRSATHPNPGTNSSHNHNVHSQTFIIKFLEYWESPWLLRYMKTSSFSSYRSHILPLKMIIQSI